MEQAYNVSEVYGLFTKALEKHNLQYLTEIAYHALGYPVLVCDDLWNPLAAAPKKAAKEEREEKEKINRHIIDGELNAFIKTLVNESQKTQYPVMINQLDDSEQKHGKELFSALYFDEQVIGYTFFIIGECPEEHPEVNEFIRLFNTFCKSIMIILKDRDYSSIQRGNHMLNYLLNIENTQTEGYELAVSRLTARYSPPYCGMLIKAQHDLEDSVSAASVYQLLGQYTQNVLYTDVDARMFLLFYNYTKEKLAEITSRLHKVLEGDVHVSTSLPFDNLMYVRDYYKQALLTMKIGLRQGPERFWYRSDLFMPLQVYEQFVGQESIIPYLDRQVLKILEFDEANHTEYLATLTVYTFCFMNAKDAANLLCVHVNTLHYRIRKLEEYFHIDFSDYYRMNLINANIALLMASGRLDMKYIRNNYFEPYLNQHELHTN